jgi:hypothetical protein
MGLGDTSPKPQASPPLSFSYPMVLPICVCIKCSVAIIVLLGSLSVACTVEILDFDAVALANTKSLGPLIFNFTLNQFHNFEVPKPPRDFNSGHLFEGRGHGGCHRGRHLSGNDTVSPTTQVPAQRFIVGSPLSLTEPRR